MVVNYFYHETIDKSALKAYYLVSDQLALSATTGFAAIKVTIAIAAGIIAVGSIGSRLLRRRKKQQ